MLGKEKTFPHPYKGEITNSKKGEGSSNRWLSPRGQTNRESPGQQGTVPYL